MFILFLVMSLAVIHADDNVVFPPLKPHIEFAFNAINESYFRQGDTVERTLLDVIRSNAQATHTSQFLYTFTLRVAAGNQTEICRVAVISRPWLTTVDTMITIRDPECTTENQGKRQLPGGETAIDINDPDVQKALDFAVSQLNAIEDFMFLRKVVNVGHVTSQIVADISYHFTDVQMAATSCDKMSTHQLSNCEVADGADVKTCEFKVLWQSWSTPDYQLRESQCV